jgi:adenylate cyclase
MWQELMEVNPAFSVAHVRGALPYRDPSVVEKMLSALREVGIVF